MAPDGPSITAILARNFIAAILTPAFLVNPDGVMTFFNEAAGELIGRRFEESGHLSREDWNEIGPLDAQGRPMSWDRLPLTVALRDGRHAYGRFRIQTDQGNLMRVEATALPLLGEDSFTGAMVVFVPVPDATREGG